MGTSTFNELGQVENDPLKAAETDYAIHMLQGFLGCPNLNILLFGLIYFTAAVFAQKMCYGIYTGNKSKSNFNT